ncbi:MAG: hypothetical protein JWP91_4120 [Fibrobacteres bacterium]|nr:hypothetical protein [Fibrobacterota bacterium]
MLSSQEMNRFNGRIREVEEHYHSEKRLHVEYVDVLNALMQVMGEPNPEVICRMDLSTEELIRKLEGHAFDSPAILGQVSDPAIEVPGSIRRVYTALNRISGTDWEILGNDKNPFPSNPCAHNEVEDITMDLAAGGLYHDGEFVHRLRKKELVNFRAKIAEKYPDILLPPMAE